MKNVLSLRPAQFVLGMREVASKVKRIKSLKGKQRKKYINDHRVPVVKAHGAFYIVDHHHFVRACWEAGIKKVQIRVISDCGKSQKEAFWKFMVANHWTHLTDQFGRCNNNPLFLPMDIRGMSDDPYRGLAWAVREAGGFTKMRVPFFEFQWANFLRNKIEVCEIREDFKKALKKAIKICRSDKAKHLPGFKE
jgi:hypothetical protein